MDRGIRYLPDGTAVLTEGDRTLIVPEGDDVGKAAAAFFSPVTPVTPAPTIAEIAAEVARIAELAAEITKIKVDLGKKADRPTK